MTREASNVVNSTWVCPPGVTRIVVTPVTNSSGNFSGQSSKILTVIPNTSYSVTINSSSQVYGNPNTFGSLYQWTGTGYIKISWME